MPVRTISTETPPGCGFDVEAVRGDFPILARTVHGKPLVFLDSAASTQKPQAVLDAISSCYEDYYSNVHRGVYWLSQESSARYEGVRDTVRSFLGAGRREEIVLTGGATEAINLVAQTWGRDHVAEGDEIVLTEMEHHANIVPWQMLCEEKGARIRVLPVDDSGALVLDRLEDLLCDRTRLVALTQVSNVLGTVNPVEDIVKRVRRAAPAAARVLVDGAQAVQHMKVDVREMDCDFFVFSGHKIYGPTGIGVLYGKHEILSAMRPYKGGGDMIRRVTFEKTEYAEPPHRFEAGTPNIAGAIGLGAALDYLTALGLDAVDAHEHDLLTYASERAKSMPGLRILGNAEPKASVMSMVMEGIHAHDLGTILDREGVAIRAGHHCAQPLMDRFGLAATARAAFGVYNTRRDVDSLFAALEKAREIFGP